MPWGRAPVAPDFLALALVFWNVHQPRRVGMGAAFVFGLLMDVHEGALFGQHALAYTLVSYGAITLHRRIQWFPLGAQAVHILPLLLLSQLASLAIRMWVGGEWPRLGLLCAELRRRDHLAAGRLAAAGTPASAGGSDETRPL